jgi:hypothetical protein
VITSGLGFHAARADVTLVEPATSTFTHHFPYRPESDTRARFDAVVDPADAASARWYDSAARDAAIESWLARPQ